MDKRLREIERRLEAGDPAAAQQLYAELLRIDNLEAWQARAAAGDPTAVRHLPGILQMLFPITDPDEQLWVNVKARSYDRDTAIASLNVGRMAEAATVSAWLRRFYQSNVQLLPEPLTRLIIEVETESNFDLEEGKPTYELLHVWDPEYREPRVSFQIIEGYDVEEVIADEDEDEDYLSLADQTASRWFNVYQIYGANRRYDDGSSGWGHFYDPRATMFMGVIPPYLYNRTWGYTGGESCLRCEVCDFISYTEYRTAPNSRGCPECGGELIDCDIRPLRLETNNSNHPVPPYLNEALAFLDTFYDQYRNRPWALNSVHPGTDIAVSLETRSAQHH